jgi:hypothetical protein
MLILFVGVGCIEEHIGFLCSSCFVNGKAVPGYLLSYIYNCPQLHRPKHAAEAKSTSFLDNSSYEANPSPYDSSAHSKEYPKDQSLQAARLANFVGIEEESHVSENACRYAK